MKTTLAILNNEELAAFSLRYKMKTKHTYSSEAAAWCWRKNERWRLGSNFEAGVEEEGSPRSREISALCFSCSEGRVKDGA